MVRQRPRLRMIALLFVVPLAACGPTSRSGAAAGIKGTITLGGVCPPARQVVTCADRPFSAQVRVEDAQGTRVGNAIGSDAKGRFRVGLPPGAYTLVPLNPRPNVPPGAAPVTATVRAGHYTLVIIRYDAGVR